jgi:hypothetical protein
MAGAFSNLMGLFTGEPIEKAEAAAEAKRAAGFADASKYLTDYTGKAGTYYDTAKGEWLPLQGTANTGYLAAADASGAAGVPGQQRAIDAFKQSGYYGLGLDAATEAARRENYGKGMGASSNDLLAISNLTGKNMATNYGSYAQGLMPWLGQADTVAGGLAAADTGQGQLWNQLGGNLAGLRTGQATADAGSESKIGEAQVAGGKNMFEGIMGVAKLAGNLMAPGAGSLLGAAGSAATSGMTGGTGFGTGNRGNTWW